MERKRALPKRFRIPSEIHSSEEWRQAPEGMRLAWTEAYRAYQKGEVPVGAALFYQGKVIARGHNLRETGHNPCGHAEILTLVKAAKKMHSWRLVETELYVTLEPCMMCLAACQQARVSKVFFGTSDPKGGALSLGYALHQDPRTHHRFEVVLSAFEPAAAILRGFFRERRKKKSENHS